MNPDSSYTNMCYTLKCQHGPGNPYLRINVHGGNEATHTGKLMVEELRHYLGKDKCKIIKCQMDSCMGS